MKRKGVFAWLLAASMVLGITPSAVVQAEESVGALQLTSKGTAAPEAWGAIPSPNQYKYQKDELAGFCHFGINTFTGQEWGTGHESESLFTLKEGFDAEGLVKSFHDAGFKKLIVTAKHHDGYCIWASEYTTRDIETSGYQGDILEEISAACTKYKMDMGLYLSPWDESDKSYGYFDENGRALCGSNGQPLNGRTWEEVEELDVYDYNEYYDNQLIEILGNDKYGSDGHFVEVWMDGAKGGGAYAQNYDFQRWFATIQEYEGKEAGYEDDCMLFGAESYTTVRWIGNENGFANEETWSKSKTNRENNSIDSNSQGGYTIGYADGNQWTVPEADARITSGWFWGRAKSTPKTLAALAEMYFRSVGHNAPLLLNVPPNNEGKVDDSIKNRLLEFGENIKGTFAVNMAEGAAVTASEVRGNDTAFSPELVLDGNDDTYWTMNDETTTGSITLDLGRVKTFDIVTIEEGIQLGQRISSFKVEYKNGNSEWKNFEEGSTIGAKRICRRSPVKADKLRISITGSYAVPLISEIGIYKATEAFEIASALPEGLENIDNTDKDISDGAGFTYTGWTQETGDQFVNGTSMWANAGAEVTLNFTGSKVWLMGTRDSNHGTADIYIDDEKVDSIDTNAASRATGQMIYESPDLPDGDHTLRLVATNKAIGLDAAAVLNNGGAGMVQFETKKFEMEEDSVEEVLVKRIGGSNGKITVGFENNPGSAVQGDYDVDGIQGQLVFEDGEVEKTITLRTKRDTKVKGDIHFTVDLTTVDGGAIAGFYTSMKVIIHDMDDPQRAEQAKEFLEECEAVDLSLYKSDGQDEYRRLMKKLKAYLENDKVPRGDVWKAAKELEEARNHLVIRELFSAEDPFIMPDSSNPVRMVEAELFNLDASNAVDAQNKYVRVTENTAASNGKEVNWFEQGNRIYMPFMAAKAGTYKVTATYRSGRGESNPNAFVWSGTNVVSGSMDVYGEEGAGQFHTAEFEIEITKEGAGELVFTADSKAGPVIDKFVFECTDISTEPIKVDSISLSQTEAVLTKEAPYIFLMAEILPYNATNQNVIFESTNRKAAEVDANGLVTAVANGETIIRATTEDGGKTAECKVKVEITDILPPDPPEPPKPIVTKPTAVKGVKAVPNIASIKVTWDKVNGADSYIVSVYKGNKLFNTYTTALNTLTVKKLKKVTAYSVKVTAVNKAGKGADSVLVKTGTCPGKSKILSVKKAGKNKVKLTFKKVKNVKGYAVYSKTGNGKYKKVGTTKKNSIVVKKIKKGKKYSFRVRAYIRNGKTYVYGKDSSVKKYKAK